MFISKYTNALPMYYVWIWITDEQLATFAGAPFTAESVPGGEISHSCESEKKKSAVEY